MEPRRLALVLTLLICIITPTLQVCFKAKVQNGKVRLRRRGRMAIYKCRRGFSMYGSKIAVCRQERWSHPPPKCIAPGCPDIVASAGLVAKPSFNSAKMSFSCQDSFKLYGPTEIFCDKVSWDKPPPVCRATSSVLECDFEQSDLCGWRQSTNDDFDWSRHSGQTQSGHTGPQTDHTYGKLKKGYYMYIETSSPRKTGDEADLLSPVYQPEQSDQCFSLWYHMFGKTDVGSLDIFIKPESGDLNSVNSSFHVVGNQGDVWLRAQTTVPPLDENFQVVIRGKRLEGYASDIAIDDARLYNCSEEFITSTTESTTVSVETTTTEPATTATITIRTRPPPTRATTMKTVATRTSRATRAPTTQTPMTNPSKTIPKRTTKMPMVKTTRRTPTISSTAVVSIRTTKRVPTRPKWTWRTHRTTLSTTTPRSRTTRQPTSPTPRKPRTTKRTRRPKTTKTTPMSTSMPKPTTQVVTSNMTKTNSRRPILDDGNKTSDVTNLPSTSPADVNTTDANNRVVDPQVTTIDLRNASAEAGNITEPFSGKGSVSTNMNGLIPLAIGIGGGVLFVIIISVILIAIWAKKKKHRDVKPYEELEPITKAMSKTSLNLNLVNDYNIIDNE